ncbi:hypothetical protein K435DRAFT_959197 [Dendrothele bispora CBS 962.96]|uniref:Uncharacterized protein n=1 Tax=Dendrothele bispora (strain CBS 962.96) TaxID=1314807 RepID=A0A4S8MZ17_DENBC|nr:hypothetical protein K435DRAFT_959197 [Dendrothele bispora CBS 962.96]
MKPSSLFSPSSWRKKKRSPSTQVDHSLPTSPVSSTFQQSAPSSLRCSLSERAEVNSDTFSLAYPLSTTEPRPLENGTRPPRRPPRPPGLDLHAPLLQSSASCPSVPVSPKSPGTPKHDLCAPPLSPSHSCPPMRYGESEQSHSNSDILKSKRSMPQLDGVWKGFLKELDEDPLTFQLPSNLAQTHSHHNSQPRCRGHRSVSSSIPKSKSTHDLSVHADMSLPGRRNKPLQRSPFSEPLYTPLSSPKPNRPKLILSQTPKDPLHELDEGDLTLSFPAPPPLFIRRKVGPLPALKPRSDTPPSPAMCSSTSSSDSTPVATPTTATPTQSSPKIPPLMITKKSSSSVNSPSLSNCFHSLTVLAKRLF